MEFAAELGDAALEVGRSPREEHLALQRAEMAHDRHVVPQVGLGETDADAGRLGRRRGGLRVEHGARFDHAGVARVQQLQCGESRGCRLVLAGHVGLPRRVVDATHGVVGVVGEHAPAARSHHVVVRVDEPGVDHRPFGVDAAGRAPLPHHLLLRPDRAQGVATHRHRPR